MGHRCGAQGRERDRGRLEALVLDDSGLYVQERVRREVQDRNADVLNRRLLDGQVGQGLVVIVERDRIGRGLERHDRRAAPAQRPNDEHVPTGRGHEGDPHPTRAIDVQGLRRAVEEDRHAAVAAHDEPRRRREIELGGGVDDGRRVVPERAILRLSDRPPLAARGVRPLGGELEITAQDLVEERVFADRRQTPGRGRDRDTGGGHVHRQRGGRRGGRGEVRRRVKRQVRDEVRSHTFGLGRVDLKRVAVIHVVGRRREASRFVFTAGPNAAQNKHRETESKNDPSHCTLRAQSPGPPQAATQNSRQSAGISA